MKYRLSRHPWHAWTLWVKTEGGWFMYWWSAREFYSVKKMLRKDVL